MTLNTSQVSYYMTQRKKGITQHISAMKAGISVRSGRRIEKDKSPGQYPNSLRRTMQRRVREWKLQYGAEQEVMFNDAVLHVPEVNVMYLTLWTLLRRRISLRV